MPFVLGITRIERRVALPSVFKERAAPVRTERFSAREIEDGVARERRMQPPVELRPFDVRLIFPNATPDQRKARHFSSVG